MLTGVDVAAASSTAFQAKVCRVAANGKPTKPCTDLTAPASFVEGDNSFTAPTNTALTSATIYAVVVDAHLNDGPRYGRTDADGEDMGQAAGWSIADAAFIGASDSPIPDVDGAAWSSDSKGLRIAIKGSTAANAAPVYDPTTATREVPENSVAGTDVGDPIPAATDAEDDTLTYSMGGTDAASFAFDASTRQITTIANVDYNHEATQNSYSVTVTATDAGGSGGSADVTVTIDVTDVAEQPAKPDPPTVTATAGAAGSLDVSWVKPDLNGGPDITGYNLQYVVPPDTIWNGEGHNGTGTTTSFPNLDPDEEYVVRVRAENGETQSDFSDPSAAVRTNAEPTVDDVAVTSTPVLETDTYGAGERIEVSVTFSEAVNATSDTDFQLSTWWGNKQRMPLVSGSGTTTLVFGYTVQSTDEDDNGIFISERGSDPGGGPQRESPGRRDHERGHRRTGGPRPLGTRARQSDHKVDGTRSIVSVAVTSTPRLETDTYGAGETIRFTVTFNTEVDVTGDPVFEFALDGGASRSAAYETGAGSTALLFGYTVVSGDTDTNGIFLWDEADLDSPDGPVRLDSDDEIEFEGTSTDVPLYWQGRGAQSGHKVDGSRTPAALNSAPAFVVASDTYTFPENSPADTRVGLVLPATDADSGDTLTYSMEGIDADSFSFDTSIREISTISGVDYNYEATKNSYSVTVKVEDGNGGSDTVAVTLEVTDEDEQPDQPAKPTLAAVDGSSTTLTASWEKPDLNGGPDITGYVLQYRAGTAGNWEDFTITGTAVTATITGLTADTEYQVQVRAKNGETDSDWSDASDAVSTNADGTPDAPTITSVVVTSRPKLTSPGGSTPDTYGAGGTIEISVTFSEAVTATTDTDFVLNVGGDKRAPLVRGSGTTTLVFGYTVQSDDDDDNGIWIGDQDRTLVGSRGGIPQSADSEITSVATSTAADLTHDALNQQEGHKVNGSRQSASAPPYFEEESTRREVAHGSPPVTPVGAPVVAMDEDTPLEDLIYSLDDATNSFVMSGRGQIVVWAESFSQASYAVTVEVRDAPGGEPDDTIAVTITITGSGDPPSKEPPTVEELTASEDPVSPGGAVVLTATASDPDGGPVTYAWSAPSGSFDQTTGRQVTWRAPENYSGDVVITVTVTDDENVTATDTVTVAVTDANRPPTVSVAPEVWQMGPGESVTLTATASDPDVDDRLVYKWTVSPNRGTLVDQETEATWTPPSDATGSEFLIVVTVVDRAGAEASASAMIEITENPTLKVEVTADSTTVAPGGKVMLTAKAFDPDDPDGNGLSYMWSAPGEGSFDAINSPKVTWTAPLTTGTVEIRVMVTNADNGTASDEVTVTVQRRRAAPATAAAAALDRAADGERDGVGEDGVGRRRGGADGDRARPRRGPGDVRVELSVGQLRRDGRGVGDVDGAAGAGRGGDTGDGDRRRGGDGVGHGDGDGDGRGDPDGDGDGRAGDGGSRRRGGADGGGERS